MATACGGGDGVAVDGAWARNSPMMASAGAVYLDLTSDDADMRMGAAVDSQIAGKVEIDETAPGDADHEMTDHSMEGMEDHSMEGMEDEGMGGAMMMREVGRSLCPQARPSTSSLAAITSCCLTSPRHSSSDRSLI